ncbi:MAG: L,D-transpeptidase [Bacillota bacterium]
MRKSTLAKFMIVLLVASLLFPVNSFSQEQDYSLKDLFAKSSEKLDGAYAEAYAAQLGECFRKDMLSFLSELANLPKDQVDRISFRVAYNCSYFDLETIKSDLEAVIDGSKFSPNQITVANQIIAAMESVMQAQQIPPGEGEHITNLPNFDVETTKKFIGLQKDLGYPVDEEFFEVLKRSLQVDPKAFVEMTAEFEESIQGYIANSVARSAQGSDRHKIKTILEELSRDQELTEKDTSVIERLLRTLDNVTQSSMEVDDKSQVGIASTPVPTIGPINYTTLPLVVGENENVRFTLNENTTGIVRSYYVEVYNIRNGVSYLKGGKNVSMPTGVSSITVDMSLGFSSTGPVYTRVVVKSSSSGPQLTARTGAYPDTVYGKWRISVTLPVNRNYKGTLRLFKADNTLVSTMECLGLSQSNGSMMVCCGNTPTGEYTGQLGGKHTPYSSYGPYQVITMTGVSGVIVQSGRSGIWIHGGDPETNTSLSRYPLRPTNGCVRISNSNQQILENRIAALVSSEYHYSTGNISII